MHLYFPFPTQNNGLFKYRTDVINECKTIFSAQSNFHFQSQLPNVLELHRYFRIIAHNSFSPAYFGELLTGEDSWKFVGAVADLDAISKALDHLLEINEKRAYIMTNTGGHHADNAHYELFCPINQLFFVIEYFNYHKNFPEIAWVDVDAHFGNGDKKLFDGYREKMKSEVNNVTGFSIHNDSGTIQEDNYIGVGYERTVNNQDFLSLISTQLSIKQTTQYVLVFFGTDIVAGDYGANEKITQEIIPQVLSAIESKIPQQATTVYIQTGGAAPQNILALIRSLAHFQNLSSS